jgi:SAM-dependent methyltransferase
VAADGGAPASLLREELPRLVRAARGRPILDLACGRGRNAREAAAAGLQVVALDRDREALDALRQARPSGPAPILCVRSDVEAGTGLPFGSAVFGAVLVFRFLFRPLAPEIERVLGAGGVLVYETFTTAQRRLAGGPRNPAFLLAPGELATLFPRLGVRRNEEGVFADPNPLALARLVAEKT